MNEKSKETPITWEQISFGVLLLKLLGIGILILIDAIIASMYSPWIAGANILVGVILYIWAIFGGHFE